MTQIVAQVAPVSPTDTVLPALNLCHGFVCLTHRGPRPAQRLRKESCRVRVNGIATEIRCAIHYRPRHKPALAQVSIASAACAVSAADACRLRYEPDNHRHNRDVLTANVSDAHSHGSGSYYAIATHHRAAVLLVLPVTATDVLSAQAVKALSGPTSIRQVMLLRPYR